MATEAPGRDGTEFIATGTSRRIDLGPAPGWFAATGVAAFDAIGGRGAAIGCGDACTGLPVPGTGASAICLGTASPRGGVHGPTASCIGGRCDRVLGLVSMTGSSSRDEEDLLASDGFAFALAGRAAGMMAAGSGFACASGSEFFSLPKRREKKPIP